WEASQTPGPVLEEDRHHADEADISGSIPLARPQPVTTLPPAGRSGGRFDPNQVAPPAVRLVSTQPAVENVDCDDAQSAHSRPFGAPLFAVRRGGRQPAPN